MNNLTKKVALVSLLLLVVSCGKTVVEDNGAVEVDVPGANVNVTEDWGVNVNAGWVEVDVDGGSVSVDAGDAAAVDVTEDGGVDVNAGWADVSVDADGWVEVDVPGVNIDLK